MKNELPIFHWLFIKKRLLYLAGSGSNDGGKSSAGDNGSAVRPQHTRRRTQRRVTHNEKRYHSGSNPVYSGIYFSYPYARTVSMYMLFFVFDNFRL